MESDAIVIEGETCEELYAIDCLARAFAKVGKKTNQEAVDQVRDRLLGMFFEQMHEDRKKKLAKAQGGK